jgi:hypothetical protein
VVVIWILLTTSQTSPVTQSFYSVGPGYVFMMDPEISWILGYQDRADVVDVEEILQTPDPDRLVYGGFLWSDLDLELLLPRFHSRLLLDFRVGWSAVGFSSRGDAQLGPWSAPTSARPHQKAPFGLYLLSAGRLKESVCQNCSDLAEVVHRNLTELGPVFCDPKLEVHIQSPRDFRFRAPSIGGRAVSALRYMALGGGA